MEGFIYVRKRDEDRTMVRPKVVETSKEAYKWLDC